MRRARSAALALVCAIPISAALGCSPTAAPVAPTPPVPELPTGAYDVVIENGRIVDGSGNAWYAGDLGIRGDRIAAITLPGRLRDASLDEAEEAGRVASILRWFALQYPGVGGVTIEKAAALEQAAAERVVRRLAVEVRDGKVGRCRSCGQSCPPWFPLCDRCARAGRH